MITHIISHKGGNSNAALIERVYIRLNSISVMSIFNEDGLLKSLALKMDFSNKGFKALYLFILCPFQQYFSYLGW